MAATDDENLIDDQRLGQCMRDKQHADLAAQGVEVVAKALAVCASSALVASSNVRGVEVLLKTCGAALRKRRTEFSSMSLVGAYSNLRPTAH